MLPFDNRPWAKTLARAVIGLSVFAAIIGAYWLNDNDELHIPEVTGIILLLLTIIPPNMAILYRKHEPADNSSAINHAHLRSR